jgi:tetratricopeptide (TPR) repeat protein
MKVRHIILMMFVGLYTSACITTASQTVSNKDQKLIPHKKSGHQEIKSLQRLLRVNLYLDLSTRQTLMHEKWQRPIFSQVSAPIIDHKNNFMSSLLLESNTLRVLEYTLNKSFSGLGIKLRLNSIHSWESSVNGKALSLDHLAHTLRSKRLRSPDFINIGLVSTSSPSFAQLSDLLWSRADVPVVIVRRPLQYYSHELIPAAQSTARLIIRGIGEYLGIAPVCDGGWGGATRDQLLGLIISKGMNYDQAGRTNYATMQDPNLRGVPFDQDLAEPQEVQWLFSTLSWSKGSQALLEIMQRTKQENTSTFALNQNKTCLKFETLKRLCENSYSKQNTPDTLHLIFRLGDRCMSQQKSLLSMHQKGLLADKAWINYQTTALGIKALNSGHYQHAFNQCKLIANHHPSLLASKCAGIAAEALGQLDLASLYLRAYLSSHPNDIESLSKLAKVLGKSGKDKEAVALLRRLALEKPNQLGLEKSRILFNLGVAEAKLGNLDAAKAAWQKLDKSSKAYLEATELLDRLRDDDLN